MTCLYFGCYASLLIITSGEKRKEKKGTKEKGKDVKAMTEYEERILDQERREY